jgi:hypothetical protein
MILTRLPIQVSPVGIRETSRNKYSLGVFSITGGGVGWFVASRQLLVEFCLFESDATEIFEKVVTVQYQCRRAISTT